MSSRRGDEESDSDDEVIFVCMKCPTRVEFRTKAELAGHKRTMHSKEKSRRQEEEEEEERILIASNKGNKGKRRSPRMQSTPEIEESEQENTSNAGSDNTADIPEPRNDEPTARKKGRPAGKGKGSPRGKRPIATSTPVTPESDDDTPPIPRKPGRPPGPKSITRAIPPWMDAKIFKEKFPGG